MNHHDVQRKNLAETHGKEAVEAIEKNLLEELVALGFLTPCNNSSGTGCDSSRCGPGQTCRPYQNNNCFCTNA
ncbi:hypothetical protein [Stenotrophomonas mori]|uniref:Uncharacterized protein n=1 Tax=Stenotrophomonas mori TaxID=2871096 RepID=A0ABT0SFJ6_9GAMM|nr:hypothetical protein [Stenotrophomonas mori]MCL7714090.1 hypothetical protein [Stenotrophomonas mori]